MLRLRLGAPRGPALPIPSARLSRPCCGTPGAPLCSHGGGRLRGTIDVRPEQHFTCILECA